MRLFIDIYNSEYEVFQKDGEFYKTKDLRYLLKRYDPKYDVQKLIDVFEKIMAEHQQLSGVKANTQHYDKLDIEKWDQLKMSGINTAVLCLRAGFVAEAKETIELFNLKIKVDESILIDEKSIKLLINIRKSIENKIKLKEIKKAKEQKQETETNISWPKKRIYIERSIGILPRYNETVEMYLSYEEQAIAANTPKK